MSESAYPSDRQDKFMLRLPDGMRDRIRTVAAANNRSMNAEIVARLEASFHPRTAILPTEGELGMMLEDVLQRLDKLEGKERG